MRRGHRLDGSTLDFGHVAAFESSWPLFEQRRAQLISRGVLEADQLVFQVGIPGDFDMALFTLGPVGALRNRRPFTEATVNEITEIFRQKRDQVAFQLEVPAELVFVARFPRLAQPLIARRLGRGIAVLAEEAPAGARFGIHLCLGDMNHRALGKLEDVAPLVSLSNAIVAAWPQGRPLEFIHAPLAAAELPPPSEPAFYQPLQDLSLPTATRFIAGFVHEDRSLDEQRDLLSALDALTGRTVDVATSCGLGRRERGPALATLDRAAALCQP